MQADHLDELRTLLNRDVEALFMENPSLFDSSLSIDLIIEETDIDLVLVEELEKLAPFGCQNERPLFQIKGIRAAGINFMDRTGSM